VTMTQEYLVGEMSICLQRLEAVTAEREAAADVVRLRRQVETSPPSSLAAEAARALAVADGLCWDSLARGDTAGFAPGPGLGGTARVRHLRPAHRRYLAEKRA
jgi:hypothetical protein